MAATGAAIIAIEYYLPERLLTNADIAAEFPGWSVEKIEAKTGIKSRSIAAPGETSLDLATKAGEALLSRLPTAKDDVDFILLCTQSPDYFLPTSACILQDRLGLGQHVGALDFNLGCSGYVYGLSLANGLISSGAAHNVLLFTAETYSKFITPQDRSVRTLFGDAGAVTLVQERTTAEPAIGPFVFGTDGAGYRNLIVRGGGMRDRNAPSELYMNGTEIFTFTLRQIPDLVQATLTKAKLSADQIDLYVFHQANAYMLDHLRQKLEIPKERFVIALESTGNTVSSSIPIALKQAEGNGQLVTGLTVMLVGFGVGYSWGATIVRWT
jgi:3-oxoacyl-[acyl-carrier-protein] synthase-3